MPSRPATKKVATKTSDTTTTQVAASPAAQAAAAAAPVAPVVTKKSGLPKIVKSAQPSLASSSVASSDSASTPSSAATATATATATASKESDSLEIGVATSDVDSKLTCEESFQAALRDAQALIVASRGMVARVREMKKVFDREMKESKKTSKKSRKQVGGAPREPTGFAKPCKIKDELADFLHDVAGNSDIKRGDHMTRTEVTKRLNAYIIKHGLRNPEDQRKILYQNDKKLSPLITLPQGVSELTYFNLQTAIKDLFEKSPVSVSA